MHRKRLAPIHRLSASFLAAAILAAFTFAGTPAFANDAKTEKEVKALQRKAIDEDNLATDYDSAIKKLGGALTLCSTDRCAPSLKGAIFRDLGAMQILNKQNEEGKKSFAEALKLDHSLQLDPSYKTDQLQTVWDDVKKKSQAASTPTPPPQPEAAAQGGGAESENTELTHTPVTEQQKHTPIPVYVEYAGEGVAKAVVKYRSGSSGEFKSVELSKMGKGWGGLIPCDATQASELSYYVVARNSANAPIATTAGGKASPIKVTIKGEISGEAPHLPGLQPPKQCGGGEAAAPLETKPDCPPGMAGCESASLKAEGEECEADNECKSKSCASGKCSAPSGGKSDGEECEGSSECSSSSCTEGKCGSGPSKPFKRVWVGVSVAVDDDFILHSSDACGSSQYVCLEQGTNAPTTTQTTSRGSFDTSTISGSSNLGQVRITGSFDYAVTKNWLLGIRAGYTTGAYSGPSTGQILAAPVHLEARASWVIGKDGVGTVGLSPMLVGGVGVAQFASSIGTTACLSGGAGSCSSTTSGNAPVTAWFTSGGAFVTAGAGLRFSFTDSVALVGLARFTGAFGGKAGFMPVLDPEAGIQVGF